MELDVATLAIRVGNFALWAGLSYRILRTDRPVSGAARRMILLVIVSGMAVLTIGALVPFGFPGNWARLLYTSFTAAASIVALSLITTGEPNGLPGDDDDPVPPPQ